MTVAMVSTNSKRRSLGATALQGFQWHPEDLDWEDSQFFQPLTVSSSQKRGAEEQMPNSSNKKRRRKHKKKHKR